jgi:hypothetical protein
MRQLTNEPLPDGTATTPRSSLSVVRCADAMLQRHAIIKVSNSFLCIGKNEIGLMFYTPIRGLFDLFLQKYNFFGNYRAERLFFLGICRVIRNFAANE